MCVGPSALSHIKFSKCEVKEKRRNLDCLHSSWSSYGWVVQLNLPPGSCVLLCVCAYRGVTWWTVIMQSKVCSHQTIRLQVWCVIRLNQRRAYPTRLCDAFPVRKTNMKVTWSQKSPWMITVKSIFSKKYLTKEMTGVQTHKSSCLCSHVPSGGIIQEEKFVLSLCHFSVDNWFQSNFILIRHANNLFTTAHIESFLKFVSNSKFEVFMNCFNKRILVCTIFEFS